MLEFCQFLEIWSFANLQLIEKEVLKRTVSLSNSKNEKLPLVLVNYYSVQPQLQLKLTYFQQLALCQHSECV